MNREFTHYFAPFGFENKNLEDCWLVKLTGKTYEVGEHPEYRDNYVLEIVDEDGNYHDVFEDELKLIE